MALPAQDTENWTFAVLFPNDQLCTQADYECTKSGHNRPGYKLTLKKYDRVLRRTSSGITKSVRRYRQVAPQIAVHWRTVCDICPQAKQFTRDVEARLQSIEENERDK